MRAELRHALWMIKGGVRVEKDSPQEAHQRINKQTSTDPFSLQLGLFWFPNWFVFPPHAAEEVEEVLPTPDQDWTREAVSSSKAVCKMQESS